MGGPEGGNSPELNLKEVLARVVEMGEEGRGSCRQTGWRVGRGGRGRAGARLTTPGLGSQAPGPPVALTSTAGGQAGRPLLLASSALGPSAPQGACVPHEPRGSGS